MIPWLFGWPSSCRAAHGSLGQCPTVRCVLCRWCGAGIGGGGRGTGAGGLPGASVVAVSAVPLLLLSLVSGCTLILLASRYNRQGARGDVLS